MKSEYTFSNEELKETDRIVKLLAENYITFETSALAAMKNFPAVYTCYTPEGKQIKQSIVATRLRKRMDPTHTIYPRYTHAQLKNLLKKEHSIYIEIGHEFHSHTVRYAAKVVRWTSAGEFTPIYDNNGWSLYLTEEEAMEEAFRLALKNI